MAIVEKYSKEQIKDFIKEINVLKIKGRPKEKFKQIEIDNKYVSYLISSYGRVISTQCSGCRKVRILKPKTCRISKKHETDPLNGYQNVTLILSTKRDRKYPLIHRLVAKAFIKNKDNLPDVNHKDGIKYHNYIWNLEWCSKKNNIKHAFKNGLHPILKGEEITNHKYKEKQARAVCSLLENRDLSYKRISKITGVSVAMVRNIYKGRSWKYLSKKYNFPDRD